jgi:hypothetical protein
MYMKLKELLQKYAAQKRTSVTSEEATIQKVPEQEELLADVHGGVTAQTVLTKFLGSRIIETNKIIKDSTDDANLDSLPSAMFFC